MSMFLNQLKNDFANISDELENELSSISSSSNEDNQVVDILEEHKLVNEYTDDTSNIVSDYQGEPVHEESLFDIGGEVAEGCQHLVVEQCPVDIGYETTVAVAKTVGYNGPKQSVDKEKEMETFPKGMRSETEKLLMETKETKSNPVVMDVFLNKQAIQNELWAFMKKWDNFTEEEQDEIIGDKNLLDDFTPEEAINIVEEWEESKRVHIGDIIVCDGVKGICIGLNIPNPKKKDCFYYLATNGGERPLYFDTELTIKTDESISLTV